MYASDLTSEWPLTAKCMTAAKLLQGCCGGWAGTSQHVRQRHRTLCRLLNPKTSTFTAFTRVTITLSLIKNLAVAVAVHKQRDQCSSILVSAK